MTIAIKVLSTTSIAWLLFNVAAASDSVVLLDAPVLPSMHTKAVQSSNLDALQFIKGTRPEISFSAGSTAMDGTIFSAKRDHQSGALLTNFAATTDTRTPTLTRLESSWVHPIADGARQLSIGDSISNSGNWGDAVRFGGIRFGSSDSSRPDLVTTPQLRSHGEAIVPTVADLLIDRTRSSSSGATLSPFVTNGLPRVAGVGRVSLSINDALGRGQVITQPLFAGIPFIAKGRTDYSIDMGRIREDFGINSNQYGKWFASSTLRYGLTNAMTLNWRAAQILGNAGVVGLGVSNKLGSLGVLSATVASSNSKQDAGWLARAGFEYSDSVLKLAVGHRVQSTGYRDIGANSLSGALRQRTLASIGLSMGWLGDLAVTGAKQTFTDNGRDNLVALSHQLALGPLGILSTAAAYSATEANASSVFILFTHRFTHRTTSTQQHSEAVSSEELVTTLEQAGHSPLVLQ